MNAPESRPVGRTGRPVEAGYIPYEDFGRSGCGHTLGRPCGRIECVRARQELRRVRITLGAAFVLIVCLVACFLRAATK